MKNAVETHLQTYETAKMDIVYLQMEDVIVTSIAAEDGGDEGNWSEYY